MSLEKINVIDKIEVLESGHVQIRTATRILEDGAIISQNFHRSVIAPGDDYSQEDAKVQAICVVTHTPEVIAAYQAKRYARGLLRGS